MTKELRDPDLPAGAVVEVDAATGVAIRNDGQNLKPAARNPWYVLATIAGEQDRGFDAGLHARNRRFWNGWACSEMTDEARAALAETMDLPVEDLAPLSDAEKVEIAARFQARLGPKAAIPKPSETVNFTETHFPMTLGMGKCVLAGTADFRSATFSGSDDLSNEGFGGKTDFAGARFRGDVPKFYGRGFHQDTDIPIQPGNWPEIDATNAGESKRAYTRLRQIMNELHKPDAEAFFGRQEMRCDAELNDGFFKALSRGYGAVSDYGHSIWQPMKWLGFVFCLPLGAYTALLESRAPGLANFEIIGFLGALAKAAGLSFANTFAFLGFYRVYFADFYPQPYPLINFVSGAQTVLGFVLLFFLGLGLRNRFRLK